MCCLNSLKISKKLKMLSVNAILTIKEVNIFKDDSVIQFLNPVQASIASNTWIACGFPKTKKLKDILPGIINQLGSDNLDNLRKLAENSKNKV
ncbi:hypothetical protein MKX03_021741 [Papaver bracteatum]|nr:hypothetical protein MKX03_021741 [Papaver bracteatum]